MECNRGEAARAKEIGERKLSEKDIAGAKKFALKAQSLYPGLDGLPQFMAILEAYLSFEKIVNGVHDYYGILGVDPLADEYIIRKHYRRLALLLHPDKNKSVGADGAFKIISEAWSVLSDPSKKNLYDQKRNLQTFFKNVSMANPSVPARKNGYSNSTSPRASQKGVHEKKDVSMAKTSMPSPMNGHSNSASPRPSQKGVHAKKDVSMAKPSMPAPKNDHSNRTSPRASQKGVQAKKDVSMAKPSMPTPKYGYSNSTSLRASQKGVCAKKDTAKPNGLDQQSAVNGVSKQSVARPNASPAKVSEKISFWTVCSHCEMQYEYDRKYFCHTLLCHDCQKPFCAVEISPPPTGSMPWKPNRQGQKSKKCNLNAPPKKAVASPNLRPSGVPGLDSPNANFQSGVFSTTVGSKATSVPSTAQAAGLFQQPNEEWNKIQKKAHAAYLKAEASRKKVQAFKRVATGLDALRKKGQEVQKAGSGLANGASTPFSGSAIKRRSINEREIPNQTSVENIEINMGCSQKCKSGFSPSITTDSPRDSSQPENRHMLRKKARLD